MSAFPMGSCVRSSQSIDLAYQMNLVSKLFGIKAGTEAMDSLEDVIDQMVKSMEIKLNGAKLSSSSSRG